MKSLRTKPLLAALAVAIAAGAVGLTTAAFARQGAPAASGSQSSPRTTPSTSPAAPSAIALCSSQGMEVSVESTEGAAGTIRTAWRAENISGKPCRSSGYPSIDAHGSNGWLGVQAHHGGYPDIDRAPKRVVVASGRSLFFVTYWSDVTTDNRSCTDFDQVKVTLPGDSGSNLVATRGCLTPDSVRVGPVTAKLPAA